jgi:hypothetical protein
LRLFVVSPTHHADGTTSILAQEPHSLKGGNLIPDQGNLGQATPFLRFDGHPAVSSSGA